MNDHGGKYMSRQSFAMCYYNYFVENGHIYNFSLVNVLYWFLYSFLVYRILNNANMQGTNHNTFCYYTRTC